MVIIFISAIIGAVVADTWYSREKQKIREEYLKQMKQYLNQLEQPQQRQTVEEHYTFLFKTKDNNIQYIK